MTWRSLGLVAAAACGGGGGGAVDAGPGPDAVHVEGEQRAVEIGPVFAAPGAEDTVCVVLDLGNEEPGTVRSLRTSLSSGTHHVIVTKVADTVEQPTPTSCGAFAGGAPDADLLFIAQQPEAALTYPDGTGVRVAAHQHVHLEMHYFNYLPDAEQGISASVTFDLVTDDGELRPVELMFQGELSLFLPAGEQVTVTSFHTVPPGAEIFALSSHTHQYGVRGAIYRATSEADPGTLLHESLSWSEPPFDTYEPFALDAGEGLRLQCEFHNTSDHDVGFGLGFNDEMCFLWAHYVVP